MLIVEQTIATRRKSGAHRFLFFETHDQHDFAKVNARIGTVKISFATGRPDWQFSIGRNSSVGSAKVALGDERDERRPTYA